MRQPLLKKYTVLIARTGQTPVTLSFTPLSALVILLVFTGIPLGWLGTVVFSLFNSNAQLSQENQQLTEKAHRVLTEIDTLDSQIDSLKERAGIEDSAPAVDRPERPSGSSTPGTSALLPPRGGIPGEVAAIELYDQAADRMPQLSAELDAQVKPALEKTLAAEAAEAAAYPSGKPLTIPLVKTSGFGMRRNPFGGSRYEKHEGVDFTGPYGTPVVATAAGRVKRADYHGGYGKTVVIDHGYGYETLYAHLSKITVTAGTAVRRGDVVGHLGNTGRSSGPHLHYGVFLDKTAVDPMRYLTAAAVSDANEVNTVTDYWRLR